MLVGIKHDVQMCSRRATAVATCLASLVYKTTCRWAARCGLAIDGDENVPVVWL